MIKQIGKTIIIAMITVIVASGSIHATMSLLNDTDLNRVFGQTGMNVTFLQDSMTEKPPDTSSPLHELSDSPFGESALLDALYSMLNTEISMVKPENFNLLTHTNQHGQTIIHGFDLNAPLIRIDMDPSGHGQRGYNTTIGINDLNIRLRGNVAITVH